jgi:ribosomal protein L24E
MKMKLLILCQSKITTTINNIRMPSIIQKICMFCDSLIMIGTPMVEFDDGHFCHDNCYDGNNTCPCHREEEEINPVNLGERSFV